MREDSGSAGLTLPEQKVGGAKLLQESAAEGRPRVAGNERGQHPINPFTAGLVSSGYFL